jgi:aminomethyltransferase
MSAKHEYFGIRNSAGFFDSSPLYKYWIRGRDAEAFLAGVMTRDVRTCRPGRAQYTVWCDDAGYLLEDGVLFRHSETEFMLTAAEPNLGYLRDLVGRLDVSIEEASADYGVLAVQGPRSRPRSPSHRSRSPAPATPAISATRSSSGPTTRCRCWTP